MTDQFHFDPAELMQHKFITMTNDYILSNCSMAHVNTCILSWLDIKYIEYNITTTMRLYDEVTGQ